MAEGHPACEQSCELNGQLSHSEAHPLPSHGFPEPFLQQKSNRAALRVACPSGLSPLIRVWTSQVPRFSLPLSLWVEQQNMQEWREQWLQWEGATSNSGSSTMNHMKVLQPLGSRSSCKNENNKDLPHQDVVGIKYKCEQNTVLHSSVGTYGLAESQNTLNTSEHLGGNVAYQLWHPTDILVLPVPNI